MKIELSFVELHSPLFFSLNAREGINLTNKIDVRKTTKGKFELSYDREHGEVLVKLGEVISIVPLSNVVSMTPMPDSLKEQAALLAAPPQNPLVNPPKGKIKAQASSPVDHVFQGPGAGKLNDK